MAGTMTRGDMRLDATLAGSYYCDAQVLEREFERIFCRSWLCAGREERVKEPGDFFTVPVGRENVLVVRDRGGEARAFYNVCRHRGARLCSQEEGARLAAPVAHHERSEEHTSELQSPCNLVCRLLLEKKKKKNIKMLMSLKKKYFLISSSINIFEVSLRITRFI